MEENLYDVEDYLFDDYGNQPDVIETETSTECEICGTVFNQEQIKDEKTGKIIYSQYKRCSSCRKKTNIVKEAVQSKSVTIKYDPYPWQKRFHASKARCKVISGAARSGKDRATTMEFTEKFIQMLNEERRDYTFVPKVHGWIIAPTYKLAGQLMREIFNTFPKDLVTNYSKENNSIETINGGLIEFRSADDPDSLVSVGLDIVWITEAARIKDLETVMGNIEDRLSSPGRGFESQGGYLLINSSPRGRTHFNTLCKFGNVNSSTWRPGWETFYISRWDNPYFAKARNKYYCRATMKWELDAPERYGDRTYEQDLKVSRSDRQYKEDILGIPSDEGGAQFPNFRDTAVIEKIEITGEDLTEFKKMLKTPKEGHVYRIGYDPAKQIDGAWVCVYDETDGVVVEWAKFEKMNYKIQIQVELAYLVRKWNYAVVRYGKTGVGEALEPFFVAAGIESIAIPEQNKNKEKLVENLSTVIKTERFKIYNIDDTSEEAVRQFEDYGYSSTEKGNITYSNMTKGGHDDAVSSAYFAVADLEVHPEEEMYETYTPNNISTIMNKNVTNKKMQGGFF